MPTMSTCEGTLSTAGDQEICTSCQDRCWKALNPDLRNEKPSTCENEKIQQSAKDRPDTEMNFNSEAVPLAPAHSLWTSLAEGAVQLRIDETCPQTPLTVPQMFEATIERYGHLPALATKRNREWEKITFWQYYQLCRQAAKSFLKLGLQRFHSVGILGSNSLEWFVSAVGAIFAGGISTGIYPTNSPEACHFVAEDSRANVIVVENQKQLEKILQVWDRLPHLKAVVQYNEPLQEKRPGLYSWDEFMELGAGNLENELDNIISSQRPNQCCVLIYTSGTTGKPKGVMLSHDNITWTAQHASRAGDMQPAELRQEVIVSYLPLSHIAAQIYDLWTGIQWGELVYFAQPDALKGSLVGTMKEANPTSHMGVPRVWEKLMEKIKEALGQAGFLKRKIFNWATSTSLESNLSRSGKTEAKPLLHAIADKLILEKVRNSLGFSRCLKYFSGAAPMTSGTLEFFLGLNITLYEAYGMSESTGPHFMSGPKVYKLHSCGRVVPGCKFKIANKDEDENGEVCLWGRNVFMGYLNLEQKTLEALDEDGWLRSGDLGRADEDGFLSITGRIKELIITAGGENVAPVPIEDAVKKELPLLSNVMLIGDKKKFLSMLLTLKCVYDMDTMEPTDDLNLEALEFCHQVGSQATKVSEIIGDKDSKVHEAIQAGIDRVNLKATSNAQRIQKWIILERDFSIAGGELGPTMKLKRPAVLHLYKNVIDSFYPR
ncbi:long-chain-fatty-acid--CoA ligase ACSBG1 [Polypterus senegalus]|uniref:long-chain-fatty-acid--CoA ligase ACSBG1 n=1 Tax=Polypterus senegalus TaxID=55291 RepID=UPI001963F6C4|nr:long-chain-fatty-acid--CoA ligase ACSBG1 [Polypterus senegalus]